MWQVVPAISGIKWRFHWLSLISAQWWRRFLGTTGWDPSVGKSNRLLVDILLFCEVELGHAVAWSVIFLQSACTSAGNFSNSTSSIQTKCRFFPIIFSAIQQQVLGMPAISAAIQAVGATAGYFGEKKIPLQQRPSPDFGEWDPFVASLPVLCLLEAQ